MPSDDLMHRFLFDNTDIRGEVITLTQSYQEALSHNQYPAVAQRLLGEFLAAASLLSSTLKFDGILTIQARGDGPIPTVMAECTHHKDLRGIVRPETGFDFDSLEDHSLQSLIGKGVIAITIQPAKGERYQGVVPLDCDTLAKCLEQYFEQSEQLKTRLWLSTSHDTVTGLLLQALPKQLNTNEEENEEHWVTATTLADTVKDEEMLSLPHEQLLYRLFNEEEVRMFDPASVRFNCSCSKERCSKVLYNLGQDEVNQILQEQAFINIDCQFCGQFYQFNQNDVDQLFSKPIH